MKVNPKLILEKQYIKPADNMPEIEDKQIQQNGIDLRICKVERVTGIYHLGKNGNLVNPTFTEILPGDDGFFFFDPNCFYNITFMEDCFIPSGMCAQVIHRSSLNRHVGVVFSGLMDSGFCSKGGCGAVFRPQLPCKIEYGTRVAQIIFDTGEEATLYNGQYQNT